MIVRVAHSGFSYPSAAKIASVVEDGRDDTIQLVRSSQIEVDVNWGRAFANPFWNLWLTIELQFKNGNFKTIDDLKKVPGIDAAKFDAHAADLQF